MPCGDDKGSCAQYVVRGQYPQVDRRAQFRPMQAVHDVYGELPGGLATIETFDHTLEMESFFHFENDPVFVNLKDNVAALAGRLQVSAARTSGRMWPTSRSLHRRYAARRRQLFTTGRDPGFPPHTPLIDQRARTASRSRPVPG